MKNKFLKFLLILMPFLALMLATTGDSVQLFETATGKMQQASYFEMLPQAPLAVCPFFAGTCTFLSLVTAAVFLITRKQGFLTGSRWSAFAGACLAVLPIVNQGDYVMLPNVAVPLMLMIQVVFTILAKQWKLAEAVEDKNPRLLQH